MNFFFLKAPFAQRPNQNLAVSELKFSTAAQNSKTFAQKSGNHSPRSRFYRRARKRNPKKDRKFFSCRKFILNKKIFFIFGKISKMSPKILKSKNFERKIKFSKFREKSKFQNFEIFSKNIFSKTFFRAIHSPSTLTLRK